MPTPRSAAGRADLPLAPVACALAAGAACGVSAAGALSLALAAPLLVVGAAGPRRLGPPCLAFLIGLLLGRSHAPDVLRPDALRAAALPAVHAVTARVLQADPAAERAQRLVLAIEALGEPARRLERRLPLETRLLLRGHAPWRGEALAPGAEVRGLVLLSDRGGRLHGFVHDRRALRVVAGPDSVAGAISGIRHRASWSLSQGFDRRDDGLARALLLGDRGRLDQRDRDLFRGTGQAHLLAVSGLHVGLLVGGVLGLLRLLGAARWFLWTSGLALVGFYVPFSGTQPSAVRAGLGAGLWFLARLAGRRPRGTALLVVVGLAVVGARPAGIAEPSFQLSFAAVVAILSFGRRLRAVLVPDRPVIAGLLPPKRAPLRTALAISLAAWLGTAPFVAEHIGRLCFAGPLLSVLALPLTALLLASGFLFLLGGVLAPVAGLSGVTFEASASALRAMLGSARALGPGTVEVARPAPLAWVLFAITWLLAARGGRHSAKVGWIGMVCLLALLCVRGGIPCVSTAREAGNTATGPYDARDVNLATWIAPPADLDATTLAGVAGALFVFALFAVRLRWLDDLGAAAAWGLGVAAFLAFGARGLAALFAPFLVATLLGKLPGATRAEARDLRQVLCNGVPAFLGCTLALSGRPLLGAHFFLGALACLGADTCATEVGIRYGGRPFRLAGRGPIEPGESGGVTAAGLVATMFGGALAPAAFLAGSGVFLRGVGVLAAAGVAGGLLDSVLGGWLQFRGRDPETGGTTEAGFCGHAPTERVSGWRWLDNDAVNLVAGFAAGVVGVGLGRLA